MAKAERSKGRRMSRVSCRAEVPRVVVRWSELPGTKADVEQAARGVVETVTRLRQVPVDAPTLPGPLSASDASRSTVQSEHPLGFRVAASPVVGTQFVDDAGTKIRLLLADGSTIELDERKARAQRRLESMEDATPQRRRVRRGLVRPGTPPTKPKLDQLAGLEALTKDWGEIIWSPGSSGATVGVLDMNEHGNTVLVHRVSGDENDTLAGQFGPNIGLVRQHPEILVPRKAVFAVNMSGTREYWPTSARIDVRDMPQRDDLILLDQWIAEGWVEFTVARDEDRIAREVIWNQIIRRTWRESGVGMWLARYGRQMDYDKDRIALGAMAMVAEEERVNVTRRMQAAKIDKGPAVGRGWGTRPRIGFRKSPESGELEQNPVQWPYILRIFELADVDDANALSTFEIARQITEEGFPITRERVRTILQDPIYCTGEWTARLRGYEIAQTPIQLVSPVPADRFQRIQDMLALRQGKRTVTPIGEFLVNYVETVHKQCAGEFRVDRRGIKLPALLKGYIDEKNSPDLRRIRHIPFVPECCKGNGRGLGGAHSWDRDLIEHAIVNEVRRIAQHPELQRQLALAARHQIATTSARLTDEQRAEIERELVRLEAEQDIELDRYIDGVAAGQHVDRAEHDRRMRRLRERSETMQRRLDSDTAAAQREGDGAPRDDSRRLRDFLEILTLETPKDPFHRQLRARLFQRILHRIEIDDPGHGPITITLFGHLVPDTAPAEHTNPLYPCTDLLDSYAKRKAREKAGRSADSEAVASTQTAMEKGDPMAVWGPVYASLPDMPSMEEQERQRRMTLDSIAWRTRNRGHNRSSISQPSWKTSVTLGAPERAVTVRRSAETRRQARAAGDILAAEPFALRIACAVAALGEASMAQIQNGASVSRSTAFKWLKNLIDAGVVEQSQVASGVRPHLFRIVCPDVAADVADRAPV